MTGDRVVKVSFSSENPVYRRDEDGSAYWEVLSHRQGDYDISRLNNKGPFLFNHDLNRQIGCCVRAWVAGQKGYAEVQFSSTEFADQMYRDVQEGTREKMSVGYRQTKLLSSMPGADGIPIRRYAWAAHEVTLTPLPADDTVGVGRSVEPHLLETRSLPFMANEYSKLLRSLKGDDTDSLPSIGEHIKQMIGGGASSGPVADESARLAEQMQSLPDCGMGTSGSTLISFRALHRDLSVGTFSQGGATVGDEKLATVLPLANLTIADRCGAVVIPKLSGAGLLPQFTTLATVQSLSESQTGDDSTPAMANQRVRPCRVSASCVITRQLELQSPGTSAALARLILKSLAIAVDRLFLFGQGSNSEPLGIFNREGITKLNFGGSATWDSIVAFEDGLTNKNVECLPESTWYVTSPKVKTKLKKTAKAATITQAIWETHQGANYMNGYQALASNQMAVNNQVGLVDFSQTAVCVFGDGVDLQYNPYTFDREGKTRITAHMWIDVLAPHPEAIAVSVDAGNQ